jgi:cytochrome P450
MMDLFSDETRRNPYPLYDRLRNFTPVLRVPPPFDAWMIFDYDGVRRALNDYETFSSRVPAPHWFLFFDPPAHTKLRALISQAFTPRMVAGIQPRIRDLSRQLLDAVAGQSEMDLAAAYSVPLPMQAIAGMIGIPAADWLRYKRWTDVILRLSYTRSGGEEAERSLRDFAAVTGEMDSCLGPTFAFLNDKRASCVAPVP